MKKPTLYISLIVAAAFGFGARDFFARTMLVVEANRLVEATRLAARVEAANMRLDAEQALETAKLLRGSNTEDAIRLFEGVIESARFQLERAKATEAQSGDSASFDELLSRIAEYQRQYPWVPSEPDPRAAEFVSRVGSRRPYIRDGRLSLRVQDVRPGNFFSRVGLKDGELIVAINGRPVDDALSEFVAALERGDPVSLSIQSVGGATREVRGTAEPPGQ